MEKSGTKRLTAALTARVAELQELLYANATHALLIVLQGIDASGKDGAIKKLLRDAAPIGVEIANFKQPSGEERAHDFLWRAHRVVPPLGSIGIFNRSHYEAVLVERVEGGLPKPACVERYGQIVDFERMLVENRVRVLKFFLHVGRAEQAERLEERRTRREKQWKSNDRDWSTHRAWRSYMEAYEDMLNATSHPLARWHLVPADRKWYRDYVIARAVVDALESLRLKWPRARRR